MKNYYLYILISLLGLSACSKDQSYKIEGKIANLKDQTIYAVFESEKGNVIDTVVCEKEGEFSIKQKDGDYNTVTLFFENRTKTATVFLEKGNKIKINGDITYSSLFDIKGGSNINEEVSELRKESANLWKERSSLLKQIKEKESNPIEEADLIAKLTNVNHQLEEEAMSYIKQNPNKETSLFLMQYFFAKPEDTRITDELLPLISPELREHFLYKELKEYSARAKRTNIGEEAPTFQITNIYGKTFKLDTVKNNYTLLIFTPSWEGAQKPINSLQIKKVNKYMENDLNIIFMSLDTNPEYIRDFAKKNKFTWNIACDSAGQTSALIDLYNVSELPLSYIIDKDRKILLKSDNSLEIEDALRELISE